MPVESSRFVGSVGFSRNSSGSAGHIIYRTGTSDFRLHQMPCHLSASTPVKNITELGEPTEDLSMADTLENIVQRYGQFDIT
jgi:hypothetical protein